MPEAQRRNGNHSLDRDMRAIILGLGVTVFVIFGFAFPDTPIGLLLRMIIPATILAFALVFGLALLVTLIGKYKNRTLR